MYIYASLYLVVGDLKSCFRVPFRICGMINLKCVAQTGTASDTKPRNQGGRQCSPQSICGQHFWQSLDMNDLNGKSHENHEKWNEVWSATCLFSLSPGPFCHVLKSQCGAGPGDNGCNVLDGCRSGKGFHHCDHHVSALHVPEQKANLSLLMLSWFLCLLAKKTCFFHAGMILILFLFLIFGMGGSTSVQMDFERRCARM